jgi:hypothetical protein
VSLVKLSHCLSSVDSNVASVVLLDRDNVLIVLHPVSAAGPLGLRGEVGRDLAVAIGIQNASL